MLHHSMLDSHIVGYGAVHLRMTIRSKRAEWRRLEPITSASLYLGVMELSLLLLFGIL